MLEQKILKGIGVSPGLAMGRIYRVDQQSLSFRPYRLLPQQLEAEIERLEQAVLLSEGQLRELKSQLGSEQESRLILEAHQLMLRDEMFLGGIRQNIREEGINAESALKKVTRSIKRIFDNIEDEYFRGRRDDVGYVSRRLLRNLLGLEPTKLNPSEEGNVIVAHDLSPSDTVRLNRERVLGFAIDVGGKTSHTAIMARSLEIPAVVALEHISELAQEGNLLIIDGTRGRVVLNPGREEQVQFLQRQSDYSQRQARLDRDFHGPALSRDKERLEIRGNIESPEEIRSVIKHGGEGIGLFRTEYLYMNREQLPDEEEQCQAYKQLLQATPHSVSIRTLDLGGDKLIEQMKSTPESNPAMGLRAIRFCLLERRIFKTQLRALLRASIHGRLKILLPLISGLEEIRSVKLLLAECRAELEAEGQAVAPQIPLGIMIELPSAVMIADLLAREVDFFAIGTNDLIQYALAVDRANEHVAQLYRPLHPAILRMLSRVIQAAQAEEISVSMCGEMAGEVFFAPVLLGLGLRELSMNALSIPQLKSMLGALEIKACEQLLSEILELKTAEEIEERLEVQLQRWLEPEHYAELMGET